MNIRIGFIYVVEAPYIQTYIHSVCAIAIRLFKFFLICLWIGRLECLCVLFHVVIADTVVFFVFQHFEPSIFSSSFSRSIPIWNASRKSFGITHIVICFLICALSIAFLYTEFLLLILMAERFSSQNIMIGLYQMKIARPVVKTSESRDVGIEFQVYFICHFNGRDRERDSDREREE